MLPGLYSAATGIQAAEVNQRIVAENLANADMPGYRRTFATFSAMESNGSGSANSAPVGTELTSLSKDFTPGTFNTTGRPLDVAIDGDGFFAVETPLDTYYTRNGALQVTPEGVLVTNAGYPILGEGGPIQIPPNVSPAQIQIGIDGSVVADGAAVGRLQIVRFADNQDLQSVGTTLFSAANARPEPSDATVLQGVRELSNVSITDELVKMIIGLRQHESSNKVLTAISEALAQHTKTQGG